jgi:hypothetical protein
MDAMRAVKDEWSLILIRYLPQQRRILLFRVVNQQSMDLGIQVDGDLREIGGVAGLENDTGQATSGGWSTRNWQLDYIDAVGQSVFAMCGNFCIGQEIDDGLDSELPQSHDIFVCELWQLARTENEPCFHLSSITRSVTAQVAKIRLTFEPHVISLGSQSD